MATLEDVQEIIREYKLQEKTRRRDVLLKRQYVYYYMRRVLKMPFEHMGSIFGQDHATALNSCRKAEEAIDINDKIFFENVEPILFILPMTDFTKKGDKQRKAHISYILNGWLTETERLKLKAIRHQEGLETNLEAVKYLIDKETIVL